VTDYPAPPTLGQHTREVLRGRLGASEAEIDALYARRVL
jgi:crotonobetainyl-CoA:carnitine CoA-transferase CaiB-like acyl-CoA transferase